MNKNTRHNIIYFFCELILGLIEIMITVFILGIIKKKVILVIIGGVITVVLLFLFIFLIYIYKSKRKKR